MKTPRCEDCLYAKVTGTTVDCSKDRWPEWCHIGVLWTVNHFAETCPDFNNMDNDPKPNEEIR